MPAAAEMSDLTVNLCVAIFVVGVVLGLLELVKLVDYVVVQCDWVRAWTWLGCSLFVEDPHSSQSLPPTPPPTPPLPTQASFSPRSRNHHQKQEGNETTQPVQRLKPKPTLSTDLAAPKGPAAVKKPPKSQGPFAAILDKISPRIGKEEDEVEEEEEDLQPRIDALLKAQEARLLNLTNVKCLNLIGTLLDDIFQREYGSAVVRGMPAGLRHSCWSTEYTKRVKESETAWTLQAASNPMQAKKRGTDIVSFVGDRLISSPRSAPPSAGRGTKLQLASDGIHEGVKDTNYPHRLHFQAPDLRERTRYCTTTNACTNPAASTGPCSTTRP